MVFTPQPDRKAVPNKGRIMSIWRQHRATRASAGATGVGADADQRRVPATRSAHEKSLAPFRVAGDQITTRLLSTQRKLAIPSEMPVGNESPLPPIPFRLTLTKAVV